MAERVLGKDEVTSSILVIGSSLRSLLRSKLRLGKPTAEREGCLAGQRGEQRVAKAVTPTRDKREGGRMKATLM